MARCGSPSAVPVTMGSPRFLTLDAGAIRCTHAWFPPGDLLEPHVHERATFGVMLAGGFDLELTNPAIRRRSLECRPGTVFTEPAGEAHGNRIGEGGASVLVLQIDTAHRDLTIAPLRRLLTDRIHCFTSDRIARGARRLARELHDPDPLSELAIESLALGMLVDAGRRDGRWETAGGRPAWLPIAEDYVHAHFRDRLRIADVAATAGVHPAHLASVFASVHGVPLGTYIRGLRLEWAAERLAAAEASIGEIAIAAGFADQSHFTRAFKAHTGRTPGAYRRAVRDD